LGFGIWDLGFGIWDLGVGIWDLNSINKCKNCIKYRILYIINNNKKILKFHF